MARLFITPREIDFISDLNKEIVKDVLGQKIYYYSVREDVSEVHDVYEESIEKVFDPPIEIESRISWEPSSVATTKFGHEKIAGLICHMHYRDILDKELNIRTGDFISYGDNFFEITSAIYDKSIFGQIEHVTGLRLTCKQARIGQINKTPHGPTQEEYGDPDAIQETFVQQRGQSENELGETNDKRKLIEDGIIDPPLTGAKSIKKQGIKSSFYDGN